MDDKEIVIRLANLMGTTRLAKEVGAAKPQVVNNWRKRGIPAAYRFQVRLLANRKLGAKLPLAWLDPKETRL